MRFEVVVAVLAVASFAAYFGPIVVKLKEVSLTVVVLAGIVLAAVDAWHALARRE